MGFKAPTGDPNECDHCGAPLPVPDARGHRTCTYCGRVTAAAPPAPAFPPGPVPPGPPHPGPPTVVVAPSVGRSLGCGSVVFFLVVVAVIAVVAVTLLGRAAREGVLGSGQRGNVAGDQASFVDGEPGSTAVLAWVTRYDTVKATSVTEVVRVERTGADVAWRFLVATEAGVTGPLLTDGTTAVAISRSNVFGIRTADGVQAWKAALPDELKSGCSADDPCAWLVGSTVVIQTKDGTLSAFTVPTGAPAWSRRLDDINAKVAVSGPNLLLLDGPSGAVDGIVLDPATGTEVVRFAPRCSRPDRFGGEDSPDTSTVVVAGPDDGTVFLAYGTIPRCVQRWETASGVQAWSQVLESGSFGSADGPPAVRTAGHLVLDIGDQALVFDLVSGTPGPTLGADQEVITPFAADETTAYVWAASTRGTEKWSVRAVEPGSGAVRWEYPVGAATPDLDKFGSIVSPNEKVVAGHRTADGVLVLTFDGATQKLSLDRLDPTSGAAVPLGAPIDPGRTNIAGWHAVSWSSNRALVRVNDAVVVVDLSQGGAPLVWPG